MTWIHIFLLYFLLRIFLLYFPTLLIFNTVCLSIAALVPKELAIISPARKKKGVSLPTTSFHHTLGLMTENSLYYQKKDFNTASPQLIV